MMDTRRLIYSIAFMAFVFALNALHKREPSVADTARIKCPSVERVVMSAPVNGVVAMVCRSQ